MSVDPNEVTNLTEYGLFRKLRELGYPVTEYMIRIAVRRREIQPVRLGNGNYFSVNDGLRWIESRRQTGSYRVPTNAAQ